MDEILSWYNLTSFIFAPSLGVWLAFKFAKYLTPLFFRKIREEIKKDMEKNK